MPDASRRRLVQLVRRADADLAEAALLVAAEARPELDVDVALLRVDALADAVRTGGFVASGDGARDGAALATVLGAERGFRGHGPGERDPDDALLDQVLARRRGLPITLAVLYAAIGRRLDVPAFTIGLPGHVVAGIGGDRPVVLDPFHGGVLLDEAAVTDRVRVASGGRLTFHRAMLRPAAPADVVRRVCENLTHDYAAAGRPRDALWTVDVKLALPNAVAEDHRVRGRLLEQVGAFDRAAEAYERYVELATGVGDVEDVRAAAVHARSRLN